jgi:two-component system, NtrC family, response regulator AtoC
MQLIEPREFSRLQKKSPALRVLVVDDEPLIRWFLAETLTDCGYDVVEAGDAAAARAALRDSDRFDVVLLDYRLPDSEDLSLLASIRQQVPKTQVILMTAFGTPEVTRGALDLGAYRVVGKPLEMHAVADLVAEAGNTPLPN